nr:hypothetical protein OG409_08850 [Streptomyces sp. NBC_00974]
MRADYPDWGDAQVARFKGMPRTAYLPAVRAQVPAYDGNREPAMTDAAMGIAVFLEDQAVFRESVERFRDRVPAYFHLKKDGPRPVAPARSTIDSADRLPRSGAGPMAYSATRSPVTASGRADGPFRIGLAHDA